jgi:hypothetical protein
MRNSATLAGSSKIPAMSPSRNSRAAFELIRLLEAEDISMRPRQIERWTEAGVIPDAIRKRLGQGRGTEARLTPDTVPRILEAQKLLSEKRRPLHEIVLILFVKGFRINPRKLKRGYDKAFDDVEARLEASDPHADPIDSAEELGRLLLNRKGHSIRTHEWKKRLRRKYPESDPEQMLEGVLTNLILAIRGEVVLPEAVQELAAATGLSNLYEETIAGIGPIAGNSAEETIADDIEESGLDEFRRAIQEADEVQLLRAREVLLLFRELAEQTHAWMSRIAPESTSFGFVIAVGREDVATAFDIAGLLCLGIEDQLLNQRLAEWRQGVDGLRILNEAADLIPQKFWPCMTDPKKMEMLSQPEWEEFQTAVQDLLIKEPQLVAALEQFEALE